MAGHFISRGFVGRRCQPENAGRLPARQHVTPDFPVLSAQRTADSTECAHRGQVSAMGGLLAFGMGPGVVLRCPTCKELVPRVAVTPGATYVDARGAAYLCIERG